MAYWREISQKVATDCDVNYDLTSGPDSFFTCPECGEPIWAADYDYEECDQELLEGCPVCGTPWNV